MDAHAENRRPPSAKGDGATTNHRPTHGSTLPVVVGAAIAIPAASIPAQMLSELRRRLSADRAGGVQGDRTSRDAERRVCVLDECAGQLAIPRGTMQVLREVARECGVRLAPEDARAWPSERLVLRGVTPLRDYQARAVEALLARQQGIIRYPAGAGKTRTAIGAIAALSTPTLILVGSLDLAHQWVAAIADLLHIEAGLVADGRRNVQPVTVATIQSVGVMEDADRRGLLGRWGMLIVDECHHAASATWGAVIDACPARYRVGLTATPEREDGLGPLVTWRMGQIIARVSHADLIARGHLQAARIRELRTSYCYDYRDPDDWSPMLANLIEDPARNQLVVDAIAADARAGHSVLALTGRVAHAERLAEMLDADGVEAVALVGSVARRRRTEILDAAREGSVRVVVATQLADEGLDIPRLSRVYQCFPAKAAGRTEQRLGRVMRPHPDAPDVAIVDVVDHDVGVLRHQARKRMAVYRRVLGLDPRGVA